MRAIGKIADQTQAHIFGDHLVANRIRNEVEAEDDGWVVWIHDEDTVDDARTRLERFLSNPSAPEFQSAQSEAARVKSAEAADLADYHRRIRNRRSVWPKFGGYGIGVLTYGLLVLCGLVAVFSELGNKEEWVAKLVLADPARADGSFLPEVRAGEYWRLISPIFLHFGPVHLIFNCMWLFQLGCMIEARRGVGTLAALVVVAGTLPMIAQHLVNLAFHQPGYVGGMSGVVYGLAGFVWMRGRKDPASGLYLDTASWIIMLIWLVVCFTGKLGPIANTAHLAGLLVGLAWGWISGHYTRKHPN